MLLYFKESGAMPFRGSPLDLESNEAIARRMRVLRKALGETQAEMSQMFNPEADGGQLWGNYENYGTRDWRRISVDNAIILAKKLSISLDWIYLGRLNYLPIDLADRFRDAEAVIAAEERKTPSRRA